MNDLRGKVGVVTGAGSGIGLALAHRFAEEGMQLVLADLNTTTLAAAVDAISARGAEVIGVPTDVGVREQIQALRDATYDRFGTAHVVCNNAGLGGGGRLSSGDANIDGWRRTLDVDFFGIVCGIEAFLPRMLEQNEGHIVNTASRQGLVASGGGGAYCSAKFAAVAATETLADELKALGTDVGVSVLCPGGVRTGMLRPPEQLPADMDPTHRALLSERYRDAAEPHEVADLVVRGIRARALYLLTHAETIDWMNERTARIAADVAKLGSPR
jgi:NAD(P)-dependent dehydrogenase (short-subunit alcohol dehydrogenase family)